MSRGSTGFEDTAADEAGTDVPEFARVLLSSNAANEERDTNENVLMARSIARSVARVVANARMTGYESECLRLMKARDAGEFIDNMQRAIMTAVTKLPRKEKNTGAGPVHENV